MPATPRYGWDGRKGPGGQATPRNQIPDPGELINIQTQSERSKSRQNWNKTPSVNQYYSIGKTLGEGTFGKVKKGIHKDTGLTVAIKILEKERIVDAADVEVTLITLVIQ